MSELTFNEKIVAIQSELKAPKNQFNSFGKYKYRSCEDILEGVKPLLNKYGLIQYISDTIECIGNRYYVKANVVVTDGEKMQDVFAYAREPENKKGMDESQITGTASSYARKYALNGMWLIDDTKDSDVKEKPKNKLEPETDRWESAIQNIIQEKITIEKVDKLYDVSDILKLREDVKNAKDKIENNK